MATYRWTSNQSSQFSKSGSEKTEVHLILNSFGFTNENNQGGKIIMDRSNILVQLKLMSTAFDRTKKNGGYDSWSFQLYYYQFLSLLRSSALIKVLNFAKTLTASNPELEEGNDGTTKRNAMSAAEEKESDEEGDGDNDNNDNGDDDSEEADEEKKDPEEEDDENIEKNGGIDVEEKNEQEEGDEDEEDEAEEVLPSQTRRKNQRGIQPSQDITKKKRQTNGQIQVEHGSNQLKKQKKK